MKIHIVMTQCFTVRIRGKMLIERFADAYVSGICGLRSVHMLKLSVSRRLNLCAVFSYSSYSCHLEMRRKPSNSTPAQYNLSTESFKTIMNSTPVTENAYSTVSLF